MKKILFLLLFPVLLQAQSWTTIYGTLYDGAGKVYAKQPVIISKTVKNGIPLVSSIPTTVLTDASGYVSWSSPRTAPGDTCVIYVFANIPAYSKFGGAGVPLIVPNAASAELSTLATPISVPNSYPILVSGGFVSGVVLADSIAKIYGLSDRKIPWADLDTSGSFIGKGAGIDTNILHAQKFADMYLAIGDSVNKIYSGPKYIPWARLDTTGSFIGRGAGIDTNSLHAQKFANIYTTIHDSVQNIYTNAQKFPWVKIDTTGSNMGTGSIPDTLSPVRIKPKSGNSLLFGPMQTFRWIPTDTAATQYWEYVTQGTNLGIGYRVFPYTGKIGWGNIALGSDIMTKVIASGPDNNIGIGFHTLSELNEGITNIAIGQYTLGLLKGGRSNIAIGDAAGGNLEKNGITASSARYNTFIGSEAGGYVEDGEQNTFIGTGSGASQIRGGNLTALGFDSQAQMGSLADSLFNSTAIGAYSVFRSSNTLVLGDSVATKVVIGHSFPSSSARLEVAGTVKAVGPWGTDTNLVVNKGYLETRLAGVTFDTTGFFARYGGVMSEADPTTPGKIADSLKKFPYGLTSSGTLGQVWKTLSSGAQGWAADSSGDTTGYFTRYGGVMTESDPTALAKISASLDSSFTNGARGISTTSRMWVAEDSVTLTVLNDTINLGTGNQYRTTVSRNDSIYFKNSADGQVLNLRVQSGGNYTLTFPQVQWVSGSTPVMTTTTNVFNFYSFIVNGGIIHGVWVGPTNAGTDTTGYFARYGGVITESDPLTALRIRDSLALYNLAWMRGDTAAIGRILDGMYPRSGGGSGGDTTRALPAFSDQTKTARGNLTFATGTVTASTGDISAPLGGMTSRYAKHDSLRLSGELIRDTLNIWQGDTAVVRWLGPSMDPKYLKAYNQYADGYKYGERTFILEHRKNSYASSCFEFDIVADTVNGVMWDGIEIETAWTLGNNAFPMTGKTYDLFSYDVSITQGARLILGASGGTYRAGNAYNGSRVTIDQTQSSYIFYTRAKITVHYRLPVANASTWYIKPINF